MDARRTAMSRELRITQVWITSEGIEWEIRKSKKGRARPGPGRTANRRPPPEMSRARNNAQARERETKDREQTPERRRKRDNCSGTSGHWEIKNSKGPNSVVILLLRGSSRTLSRVLSRESRAPRSLNIQTIPPGVGCTHVNMHYT